MLTSKSPRTVAMVALTAGKEAFSDYSHKFSPKTFTQPQLFACLVLKEFEKKDYRGVRQLLLDWPELCQVIGLKKVPHYTTLQKASRRLLQLPHVRKLLKGHGSPDTQTASQRALCCGRFQRLRRPPCQPVLHPPPGREQK
jgi:hypothetical protein